MTIIQIAAGISYTSGSICFLILSILNFIVVDNNPLIEKSQLNIFTLFGCIFYFLGSVLFLTSTLILAIKKNPDKDISETGPCRTYHTNREDRDVPLV